MTDKDSEIVKEEEEREKMLIKLLKLNRRD